MNLAEILMKEIEVFWADVKGRHPLFKTILENKTDPSTIALFIANIEYLVVHTPIHLRKAKKVAENREQKDLAAYLQIKIDEEEGHDVWAKDDLKRLRQKGASDVSRYALPTMEKLIQKLDEMIERDPYEYLAYILYAEYFTVISADECFSSLTSKSDIHPDDVTVISKHAELDKEHVSEFKDTFVTLPAKDLPGAEQYREVLQSVFHSIENFWSEVHEYQNRSVA